MLVVSNNQSSLYIASEVDYKTGEHGIIHEVVLPPDLSSKNYAPSRSIGAFQNGKRKGASKTDKRVYRDRCCWGPRCLFVTKTMEQWEQDCEMNAEVARKMSEKYPDITDDAPDPRSVSRIVHNSVWDFYKAIGFDYKSRCYRDKDGKEIKYSVCREA